MLNLAQLKQSVRRTMKVTAKLANTSTMEEKKKKKNLIKKIEEVKTLE